MQKGNTLKDRVKEALERRGVKIPALAKQSGIPKDRIYAWYRDNTDPKMKDVERLENWLSEEKPSNIEGNGVVVEEKIQPTLLESLVSKLITLSDTTNHLLQEQKKQVVDKIEKIDFNLNAVSALSEKLVYEVESGRTTILRSLSRLEKKPEDHLVNEADNLKIVMMELKDEIDNSLEGRQNTGTMRQTGEVK